MISEEQVWVGVVGRGCDGVALNSSYNNRYSCKSPEIEFLKLKVKVSAVCCEYTQYYTEIMKTSFLSSVHVMQI